MDQEITDPILRQAAGLDPILAKVSDKDILQAPRFETDFSSLAFPSLSGKVALRYANVSDTLKIEALCLSGGPSRRPSPPSRCASNPPRSPGIGP